MPSLGYMRLDAREPDGTPYLRTNQSRSFSQRAWNLAGNMSNCWRDPSNAINRLSQSIFFDSDFDRLPCTSRENFRKQAAIVCFVRYPPRRCQNLSGPAASKQRSPRSTRHPECAARQDKYLAFHGHGCDFCLQNVQSVVSHNPCLHSQKPAL